MILLEPDNRILGETVRAKILPADPEAKRLHCDVKLHDFDNVSYHVSIAQDARSIMMVSVAIPCWHQIKDNGGEAALQKYYGPYVHDEVEAGYDVTLRVDLDNLPEDGEELAKKLALVKSNLTGGPFDKYLATLTNEQKEEPYTFDLRPDTAIYFVPKGDRVVVIFAVDFKERTDLAIAKIFLQEFVESRRHLGRAPPVAFSPNPPREMEQFGVTEPSGQLGFVSFAVLKEHVGDDTKRAKVVAAMQTFRQYLQYHIKASKTYFHQRMRARVVLLLKILNRAKTDVVVKKKTMSGKTFARK